MDSLKCPGDSLEVSRWFVTKVMKLVVEEGVLKVLLLDVLLAIKCRLYDASVQTAVLHCSEIWVLNAEDLQTKEMQLMHSVCATVSKYGERGVGHKRNRIQHAREKTTLVWLCE